MQLEHLNTRVSDKAMARILAECSRRFEIEAAKVSVGRIVNELVMKHLPPTEEETAAAEAQKKAARPIVANGRARASKPAA